MPEGYNISLFILQIIIIFILFAIMIWLLKLVRAIRYEKRISKYTIDSIKEDSLSFFDRVNIAYFEICHRLSKALKKIRIFDTYSKKYEKYIDGSKQIRDEPMDYISTKILCGILVFLIVLVSDVLQYKPISLIQVIYSLLIGFFLPDLFLISRNQFRKRQIENDLLKSIIIMNNAFKSGRSTMQAIQIVSEELDGPLAGEFKKMYIDLTYGLSLETVFTRFAKRVNIEEVKYITTSLTILNKTGGDIVKVFSSIERSFFNRRKLQQELKSLTASARLIFNILVVLPFVLFLMIFILNPTYFNPLFTTPIGLVILLVIVLLYTTYIFIIRRIMKVEE